MLLLFHDFRNSMWNSVEEEAGSLINWGALVRESTLKPLSYIYIYTYEDDDYHYQHEEWHLFHTVVSKIKVGPGR